MPVFGQHRDIHRIPRFPAMTSDELRESISNASWFETCGFLFPGTRLLADCLTGILGFRELNHRYLSSGLDTELDGLAPGFSSGPRPIRGDCTCLSNGSHEE